jgi:hypothetical protein
MQTGADPASQRLAVLVEIERRCRNAPRDELPFVLVNETARLIPYLQAALWSGADRKVSAISGVAVPEPGSPMVQWLERFFAAAVRCEEKDGLVAMTPEALDSEAARQWEELTAPQAAVLALHGPWGGPAEGILALFRNESFSPAEFRLLTTLAESQGYALAVSRCRAPTRRRRITRRTLAFLGAVTGLALLLALPVRQSALAPAEVVTARPQLVRAPLDGVVDKVFVFPNQAVKAGQPLLALDGEQLRSRLTVARKAQDIALTEYQQALQQAFSEKEAKTHLALLRGKVEQQRTEADYLESLLGRISVTAPADGVVLFDDQDDWLGRPVLQGQRIMTLADPGTPVLQVYLPMAQAIALPPNAEVLFFPNVAPDHPLRATLTQASYLASLTTEAGLAFRLTATFSEPAATGRGNPSTRIGMRGTAKCFGNKTFLGAALLNRPLSLVRQWFSW